MRTDNSIFFINRPLHDPQARFTRVFPPSYGLHSTIDTRRLSRLVKRPAFFESALLLGRFAFQNLDVASIASCIFLFFRPVDFPSEKETEKEGDHARCCLHAQENRAVKVVSAGTRCNRTPIKATPIVTKNEYCGGIIVRGEDAL